MNAILKINRYLNAFRFEPILLIKAQKLRLTVANQFVASPLLRNLYYSLNNKLPQPIFSVIPINHDIL